MKGKELLKLSMAVNHRANANRRMWAFLKDLLPERTNAECIREWSDGDLEAFILAVHLGYTPWCDYHCKNKGDDGCDLCIRKWLQEPPKED